MESAIFFVTYAHLQIYGWDLKEIMHEIIGRSWFAIERPNGRKFIRDQVPEWAGVHSRSSA